jgi:hypothetical protein
MKVIRLLIIPAIAFLLAWYGFVGIYKASKGTFMDGGVVIYKGRQLFQDKEGCAVSTVGADFHEVRRVCLVNGKTVVRIWIDGVEVIK